LNRHSGAFSDRFSTNSFINRTPTHLSYGYDFGSRGDVLLPEFEGGHFDEDGLNVRDAIVEGFQKRFPRAPFKEINEPCRLILSFLYGVQDLDEVWHSEDFFQPVGFTEAVRNILVFLFEMWGLVFSIPRVLFPCMFTVKLWRARRAIGCFLSCIGICMLIFSFHERLGDDISHYLLVWVWSYGVFYIVNTLLPYCMDRQLARGLLFKPFPFTIKGIHGRTTVGWLVPCLGIFFAFFISGIYTIFKDSIADNTQFFPILAQIMAYATFLYGVLYWTVNFALSSDIHALQNMKPTNIEIAKMDFYMNHYVSGAELHQKITGYEERRGVSGLRDQESVPFLLSERRSRLVRRKMYQTIEVDDDSSMNSVYAPESFFAAENANQFFSLRPFANYGSGDPERHQSPHDVYEAEFFCADGNHHSTSLKGREPTVSPSPMRHRPRIERNATPWHTHSNYNGYLRKQSSMGFSSGFSYSQLSNSIYHHSMRAESEYTSWEPLFRTPSRSISVQRSMKSMSESSQQKRQTSRKSLEVPERRSMRRRQNSQEIPPYQRKVIYE